MKVVAFLACTGFLFRVDCANNFKVIFGVTRSMLNMTYNVVEVMDRILNKIPAHVVRRYVPKSLMKELHILINSETLKQVENKQTLSGMIFRRALPHIASSSLQDLSQVGELTDKVEKWAVRIYSPGIIMGKPWMLFDRDPRWYPDCIGRYRCKRANDNDMYAVSRYISWTLKPISILESWRPSNLDFVDTTKSTTYQNHYIPQDTSQNTTVDGNHGSKS